MSLSIISRPQKNLYVNEPVQVYDEPYYTSFWVAAHLPCVYRIESNLWPNNRQDLVSNFNAVYNYSGNAAIDLTTGFYTIYKLGDFINIRSSTVSTYVGVWRVIGFAAPDIPILDLPFVGNAGGVAVKYYNNYSVEVEVYTGFDTADPNASVRPMQLRATLKLLPDTNNIATVDVSKIVQADFSPFKADETIAGYPNDRNHWTQFYIRFRDRYNVPAQDGTPSLFTGGWQIDTVAEDCEEDEVVFSGSHNFGASLPSEFFDNNDFPVQLKAGNTYRVEFDYTINVETIFWLYGTNLFRTTSGTIVLMISPLIDEPFLRLIIYVENGSASVNITSFDVTQISTCTAIINSTNSVLQPRATYGSNMGKYVLHDNGEQFANRFLDDQSATTYFDCLPFTIDFILSTQAALLATAYGVPIKIVNSSNEVITQFTPNGQGLYRIPVELEKAECVQAQVVPPNTITFADFGTFEANDTGVMTTNGATGTGRTSGDSYEGAWSYGVNFENQDWRGAFAATVNFPSVPVLAGYEYELSLSMRHAPENIAEDTNVLGVDLLSEFQPIRLQLINGSQTLFSNELRLDGTWQRLILLFTATANTASFSIRIEGSNQFPILNNTLFYIDTIALAGPLIKLSESKCIAFNNQCTPYGTYLKWLNPLGGYRYWYFKGAQSSTVEPLEATEIKRNIYGNWDKDFIAADTERDYIAGGGNEVITLRSDTLTKEQADLVATVMNSTKVYRYIGGRWETVLVQKGSLAKYSQRDKLVSLSIDIVPTFDILSQEQ